MSINELDTKVSLKLMKSLQKSNPKNLELQWKQQLGWDIIMIQEEERKRVSREIHDGPAQDIANLMLKVEICERLLQKDPSQAEEELGELKQQLKQSMQEVRRIIYDLRPLMLEDLGLEAALKKHISQFQEQCSLEVDFHSQLLSAYPLNSVLEKTIFRILQEALNNIQKHAQAAKAEVHIKQSLSHVNIVIRDDGCGFDVNEAFNEKRTKNFGLQGIRERVHLLDGQIKIDTAPGKGTGIYIAIPSSSKA